MPAERLVRLSEWMDDETAAAVFLKGLTAQYLLKGAYPLRAGETALVHAAAGGVGLLLCQWANHLGAQVIGAVSSESKAEVARANGCHHAVVLGEQDAAARVRALTDGRGVDVAYESGRRRHLRVGRWPQQRRRGHAGVVRLGVRPGPAARALSAEPHGLVNVTSAGFADYTATRAELLERAADLFEMVTSGAVRVAIHQRYPLVEAERAHRDLQARRTTGSSVPPAVTDHQPSADATVPLHYRIDGHAGAAAERLMLIHPVGLDHTCFDGLVAALGAGVAVLRMDLRGHGRSPMAPSPDGVRGYARDVHALLAATRFAPAVVVGFCSAAWWRQWLAVTFPADVAALVAGVCACTLTDEQRRMLEERGGSGSTRWNGGIVEATLERWFSEGFRRGPRIAPFRQRLLDDSPEGWAQAWQAIAALDVADRPGHHQGAGAVPGS